MLNLLRLGTGLAVVLALVSVNLWRELRAERQLTAELRAQGIEPVSPDPASAPAMPVIEVRSGSNPAPVERSDAPALPSPATPGQAVEIIQAVAPGYNPERDLMRDPEYRKGRLSQQRMRLKRTYTFVAEELDLSEAETEKLFDILAEQQVGGRNGPEEALRALLGPGRQAKWQEYQQTLSARNRTTEMTGMLATSGHPLTEAQLRPLTSALIAEEKFVRQQQQSLFTRPALMTPEARGQQLEEQVNLQEQSNRRYLDAAAPYMSPQQLALVRDTLEWQIAMTRASARMQRERLDAYAAEVKPP